MGLCTVSRFPPKYKNTQIHKYTNTQIRKYTVYSEPATCCANQCGEPPPSSVVCANLAPAGCSVSVCYYEQIAHTLCYLRCTPHTLCRSHTRCGVRSRLQQRCPTTGAPPGKTISLANPNHSVTDPTHSKASADLTQIQIQQCIGNTNHCTLVESKIFRQLTEPTPLHFLSS